MQIIVNGANLEIENGLSVSGLLVQLGKACDRVAVECNGEVVELESFSRVTLRPNDRLELVHFVGGG